MIPIKILCGCGQKYAFDVEPVGGHMGYAVQCPVCSADGTAVANQLIARHLSALAAPARGLRVTADNSPREIPLPPPRNLAPAAPAAHPKPARTKWLVMVMAGTVILVFAVWFGRIRGQPHASASAAGLANDGLPHTLAQLNAWYVEPPENAATMFLQGFDAMHVDNLRASGLPLLGQGKLPPVGTSLPGSMRSALAALEHSNRDALQFFAQGARFEHSRYPMNLAQGIYTASPHLPRVRTGAMLAELSAIFNADANHGKQAADDVLVACALARSLEAEPQMISQFVRAGTVANAVTAWEQTLNRTTVPRESLSELSKVFKEMEDYEARGEGFNRAIAAERVTWMTLLAAPPKFLEAVTGQGMDIPAAELNSIVARLQKARNLKGDAQYFETTFQQLMASRKAAFPVRLKADDLIRQRVTGAANQGLVIAGLSLRALAGPAAKEAGGLANLRLGLTATALEQFRQAHANRYPVTLAELAPDYLSTAPMDPFDGQPIRYRTKGEGYLLYSIGPDLKDDSGARLNGNDGDLVFAVVTPPRPKE
jgi:hypothetical protein